MNLIVYEILLEALSFLFSQALAGQAAGLSGKSGWRCCMQAWRETRTSSAAAVSNVMTADSTETQPGPPCLFPLSTCFLDCHGEIRLSCPLLEIIMTLRSAPKLREV